MLTFFENFVYYKQKGGDCMGKAMSTRIKKLRESSGMTQTELAEKIGVSKSVVSAYEKGIRNPSNKTLQLIADIFGVSLLSFFEKGHFPNEAVTINITDLTTEQQKIIFSLINEFRRNNESL